MKDKNIIDYYDFHGLLLKVTTPYKSIINYYRSDLPYFFVHRPTTNPKIEYIITNSKNLKCMEDNDLKVSWKPFPGAELQIEDLTGVTKVRMTKLFRFTLGDFLTIILREKFLQNGFSMQHSGGVIYNGNAIMLSAFSNVGKSTLTYLLLNEGYGYLGDDQVILSPTGTVLPFPTKIGLHYTMLKRHKNRFTVSTKMLLTAKLRDLASRLPSPFTLVYPNIRIHPQEFIPTRIEQGQLTTVFLLRRGENQVQQTSEEEAINELLYSTFYREDRETRGLWQRYSYCDPNYDLMQLREKEKETLRKCLEGVECYKLTFKSFDFAMNSIMKLTSSHAKV